MARIKYFIDEKIAIYIYGELNERHHGKHVLVLKVDEECNYGFDGRVVKNSKALRSKKEHKMVSEWIRRHRAELDAAWTDVNNGVKPQPIND